MSDDRLDTPTEHRLAALAKDALNGRDHPSLQVIAEAIGHDSDLLQAAARVRKRPDNVLGLLVRPVSREEIAIMEGRGCRADDWSLVQVAEDFDPFRVRRTHFVGACVIGRFASQVEVIPGITLPTGIYDCTLISCQVGNDCLMENVRFAANAVIEREAVLFDVGSITCSGTATFGCGQELPLAVETGGRELPLWAEVDVDSASTVVRERGDGDGQAAVRAAVAAYVDQIRSPVSWVCRGAVLRHTERLHDVFIGPSALIDHALGLCNVAVLSSPDEASHIGSGTSVDDAVLQWGVRIDGNAIIRRSVLLEHSGVDQHGMVDDSLIGPNTLVAKAEVTASLVGPFVGLHHQSLLIATCWPEGRGNIAYGAMVGSNHTGRRPDQEAWPGEGNFFGLGCSIRFPADYSQSPYSLIAAGVSTLPQRVRYPFSLITTPLQAIDVDAEEVPRAFNELLPAWTLYANAYGLERTEMKLARRDRARRHRMSYHVLRPTIMAMVRDALRRLESIDQPRDLYTGVHIAGLGKNFLRESSRQKAIESYRRALVRWALRILLGEAEDNLTIPGSAEIAHQLLDSYLGDLDRAQRFDRLVAIEEENARIVQSSREVDFARGQRIIPGYADVHIPPEQDEVVQRAWERVAQTRARIAALGR